MLHVRLTLANWSLIKMLMLRAVVLLQMPTVVLGQDEVDCFAAWVSAEAGLPEHVENGSDLKVRLCVGKPKSDYSCAY